MALCYVNTDLTLHDGGRDRREVKDTYEREVAPIIVPMAKPMVWGVAICAAQACWRERMA